MPQRGFSFTLRRIISFFGGRESKQIERGLREVFRGDVREKHRLSTPVTAVQGWVGVRGKPFDSPTFSHITAHLSNRRMEAF